MMQFGLDANFIFLSRNIYRKKYFKMYNLLKLINNHTLKWALCGPPTLHVQPSYWVDVECFGTCTSFNYYSLKKCIIYQWKEETMLKMIYIFWRSSTTICYSFFFNKWKNHCIKLL